MTINLNNYEEWMIDYIEGNLSPAQQKQFSEFLEHHPELKSEFELFNQTTLKPDEEVIFANKEILKKKEPAKIIPLWVSFAKYSGAVAAALLLFIGIKYFNGDTEPVTANKYAAKYITGNEVAFDRKTDKLPIEGDTENDTHPITDQKNKNVYYAQTRDGDVKSNPGNADNINTQNKNRLQNVPLKIIESPSTESFAYKPLKGRLKSTNAELNFDTEEKTQVAATNNSILDKFNNALAVADNMGDILGITKKSKPSDNEATKTTEIKLFDIKYYNRKKIDSN